MLCFLSPQISQIYTDFLASGLICAHLRNLRIIQLSGFDVGRGYCRGLFRFQGNDGDIRFVFKRFKNVVVHIFILNV